MVAPVEEPTAAPVHEHHRTALAVAIVSGALVALQQRINGGLDEHLGDPVLTAVVSFGTGLALCVAVVAARRVSRRAIPALRDLPRWWLLGGLGGASLVAVGATAAPEIGVALLAVGLVGGQTVGGLLVDGTGLGPGGRRPLTAPRAVGAVLCLAAIGVSALGRSVHPRPVLLALVVGAGLLIAVQQALNGRVRHATGDPALATLVNFVVGTAALLLGLLVRELSGSVHVLHWPTQWWFYTGGPLGAAFVAAAAIIVRQLGVLRLGLALTAGQLLGALVLDALVPERGHTVAPATVAGAALTLAAVSVSGRRTARS